MNKFKVKILAADKIFYEGECTSLIIPTTEGEYGILAHHSNMLGAMMPGLLKVKLTDDEDFNIASISNGIFKIENNEVLLLVDSIERPEEIDINRAERDAKIAKEALLQKMARQEYYTTQIKLARAINRLRVKSNIDNNINH